jgi:hypothetical protein
LGTDEVGLSEGEEVALDFDIDVVFEGEGDGVLEGEIELAVAEEGFDASGVREVDGRHGFRFVGLSGGGVPVVLGEDLRGSQQDTKGRKEGTDISHLFEIMPLLAESDAEIGGWRKSGDELLGSRQPAGAGSQWRN